MTAHNTEQSFGWVARTFHWLTALLILTAIPLGVIANDMAFDTQEALAAKAQLFSIHKTVGVAAFAVAVLRILWAIFQPKPKSLHPERRVETTLAETVHWLLYISLVIVPLSGWIHHAAVSGFAPILWPLGQDLPFIPESESLAAFAAGVHWVFTKVLAVSILLHIAGALKHHLIDKDATLRRMTRGEIAPAPTSPEKTSRLPLALASVIYLCGFGLALALTPSPEATNVTEAGAAQPPSTAPAGNWQVQSGTLALEVRQMGQAVSGQFSDWTADIQFDEDATGEKRGTVTVRINTGSLTLGSVSDQAKGKDFFDVAAFPEAVFTADIASVDGAYAANGTLTLRGVTVPVALPFTLAIDGNTATMSGTTELDRRSYGMGTAYGDEATVGFFVTVKVDLVAQRVN